MPCPIRCPIILSCATSLVAACGESLPTEPLPADSPANFVTVTAAVSGPGARPYVFAVAVQGVLTVLLPDSSLTVEASEGTVHVYGVPGHCSMPANPVPFSGATPDTLHVQLAISCPAASASPIAAVGMWYTPSYIIGVDAEGNGGILLAAGIHPVWSPDGNRIAFLGPAGGLEHLYVLDPDGGTPIDLGAVPATATDDRPLAWSPDGSRIAVSAGEELRIVPVAAGAAAVSLSPGVGQLNGLDWAPGGDSLVVNGGLGIQLIAADGGGAFAISEGAWDFSPSWSPVGGWIAFARRRVTSPGGCFGCASGDPFFSRASHRTGDTLMVAATDGSAPRVLGATSEGGYAWSPDGTRIAYVTETLAVRVSSPGGGETLQLDASGTPSWTADGQLRVQGDAVRIFTPAGALVRTFGGSSLLIYLANTAWR